MTPKPTKLSRRQLVGSMAVAAGAVGAGLSFASSSSVCGVDVLVVGGGIQGLLVLRRLLAAGYAAVLVDRGPLGGQQTCHSHVYIHQGHVYNNARFVERLRRVAPFWDELVRTSGLHLEAQGSVYGFASAASRDRWTTRWRAPEIGLQYAASDVPGALAGSATVTCVTTPEYGLNGHDLVRKLAAPLAPHIGQVRAVRGFEVASAGLSVRRVVVETHTGAVLTIEPRLVVLCAGMGNAALLREVDARRTPPPRRVDVQEVHHGRMLVVRGRTLPRLAGFFPDHHGLLVVSRAAGDDTVWLVDYTADKARADRATQWTRGVIEQLQRLVPRSLADPTMLRWGTYAAAKTEPSTRQFPERRDRVEAFGYENLLVSWPVKLTLAPLCADEILAAARHILPPPPSASLPAAWRDFRTDAAIAPERWETTTLLPWPEFVATHEQSR